MYRVEPDANINGTSFHGVEIEATTQQLQDAFGPDHGGDEYKVSHEWTFEDEEGNCFTLYAWKDTHLYDLDYGWPSPDTVRYWHVGSHGAGEADFAEWVKKQLK
jgi:hypothetical protein